MLNPQEDEYMIDTVAGSSGFPVHTIFHVWRQILNDEGLSTSHLFSLEDKPPRCKEYVEDKVFAIDFDEKVVRVARTLNLIAGDGRTNVLHLRQSTEETVAVKSFAASFLSSGRLDAEYYQPKYDQAEEAIKDCGFPSQNLGSLIEPIQNGFDYREYTEEGTPYIRVGDVKNGQINFENAVKIPITMADVDKPVGLQVGDILFTRKGSFGNSAVVTELEINGIISSEIMLVRLTSISRQEILPEYVSLFLNSKFCYLQVERRVHGVAYYSISQPDLANLLIPLLPKPQQQKIAEKIKSSFSLKLNPNNC